MYTDHNPYDSMFAAANEHYHTLRSVNENGAFAHIAALAFNALQPSASQAEIAAEFVKASNRVAIALEIARGATPNRDARYLLQGDNSLATVPRLAMDHSVVTLPAAAALPLPVNLPTAVAGNKQ
jgi:hypothetical protein